MNVSVRNPQAFLALTLVLAGTMGANAQNPSSFSGQPALTMPVGKAFALLADAPATETDDARVESGRDGATTLPPVTVEAPRMSPLRENDPVGTYGQPRWTASRRFPGVRTYVIPENSIEFEYWTRADIPRHGAAEIQHMFELEFGLPHRLQLDLYGIARTEGSRGRVFFDQQVELRYALANYGKLWGNPALYVEYIHRDDRADKVEAKLLLTGEIAPRWHWAQNILVEAEIAGEREYEYGWTGGLSYTVIDEKFSVGAEAQFSLFDTHWHRGRYRDEAFIGPSLQYRPTSHTHLDFAPLIGVDHETPAAKLFFIFGYEF